VTRFLNSLNPAFAVLALTAVSAFAQDAAPAAKPDPIMGTLVQLPVFAALFALFYFGMIRPQRQQAKKHVEFLTGLTKGDEVVLASGLLGKVVGLTERVASVEVSPGVEVKVLKTQIQSKATDALGANA
jgi:preprotein translocase subunit YajC